MCPSFKKWALLLVSGALLLSGGALFLLQAKIAFWGNTTTQQANILSLTVNSLQGQASELQGAFPVDSVDDYVFQQDGKDAFSLLLVHYKDTQNQQRRAVIFPKGKQKPETLPNPVELRHTIWAATGNTIGQNTPKDALILSWWDDGQRVHFLSGREAWADKPATETFISPVWQRLQDGLLLASEPERSHLSSMAHWLTMDSDKALADIKQTLGTSRPIYLLVTNDLLMRLGEMVDYGGAPLALSSKVVPAHDNLHGDIAQIKQWAYEEGDGNYLVQKEGLAYHVWATKKGSGIEKNSLLVRLLPFVDSLKKLPESVHLVYQSHWGGYLSIYRIEL